MRLLIVTIGALLVVSAGSFGGSPAHANSDKEPALLERIKQLEERVAQLEKTIKKLESSAKEPPKTGTESKLIGTWMVVEADRKLASFRDMKFKGDGTCAVVWDPRVGGTNAAGYEMQLDATYQVIGTQLSIEHRHRGGGVSVAWRIASLTGDKLVVSGELEGKVYTVTYNRAK